MMYSFRNHLSDKITSIIHNKYEKYTQKIWTSKPHHVKCMICKDKLYSHDDFYKIKNENSPEQMGWEYVRSKTGYHGYICHSCLSHHEEKFIARDEFLSYFKFQKEAKDDVILDNGDKAYIELGKNVNVDILGLIDLALDICNIKDKEN